ncbi:MAG: pyruvate dehydrogenase complex dihydrolipoamide acetyltransferase [Saprospiraceae bacterium]|nr:pyruvate dehydrogenase complex dihydrolipoamide acetyltransferase [Saprospiraceae bacterium]
MAEVIRMPRLSDTMEEGVIVGWLKKVGDEVEPGDILAEVETDKATMELESYHEGYLLHIGVKEGPVPVNGVLAVIGEKDEAYQEELNAALASDSAAANNGTEEVSAAESAPTETIPSGDDEVPGSDSAITADDEDGRVKASPLARKMAKEQGIDISKVRGSGAQGRIVKQDILSYKDDPSAGQTYNTDVSRTYQTLEGKEVPVSQMRKAIARRLGESKFSAPHFYVTMEIDMTAAIESRKALNVSAPPKISFNDMIVKAVGSALKQHPAVNASWLGDKISYHGEVHIGVAVAVEDGLLVPVIRHADQKPLSVINAEVKALADKARDKKLQPDEMQGNTFTISNLGMFSVEEFTAIINPPDAAILAVGGIIEKPVVKNGQIEIGHRMKVTLSSDHRVVDGATAAQFLLTLKDMLEHPVRMLL